MVHEWYFAPSNGGQTSGLNDSGLTYFESDPIRSIAKETIQDSMDALYSKESKTIVKFNTFNITKNEVPDYTNLYKSFESGIQHWGHIPDAKNFFEQGLQMLNKSEIPVLGIQDYKTTGLSKIGKKKTGGWYALVSASGVTEKSATDGGSFGIGKHAPFAASALRTVLYSTKNRENEIGFQGVARIPTITNDEGKDTQGIGYFYNTNYKPIIKDKEILEPYRRNDYGTDKFILGFNDSKNWENRLIDEVISSYLLAIYDDKLEVYVNGFIINKSTLPKTVEIIKEDNKKSLAPQYYEVLTSNLSTEFKKEFTTDTGEKEKVKLHLLAKEGFVKRVGMHRSTGMKIYDKGNFQTPIDFSGVFIVEGKRLNEILRKMEPPTHDAWHSKLFKEDKKFASTLIGSFNEWLNDCARELLGKQPDKNIQIPGIEDLLPDLSNEQAKTIKVEKEGMKDRVKSIQQPKKTKRPVSKPKSKIPKPKENGKDKKENNKRAKISKIRVYCTKPAQQIYTIFYEPQKGGEISFEIKAVGEDGKTQSVDLLQATMNDMNVNVTENTVGPFYIEKQEIADLKIKINTSNRLALEVVQL